MTTPTGERAVDALQPVRAELLRAARADAAARLTRAEQDAGAVLDEARARAAAILDEAREQGEADGTAAARAARTRARRTARSRELALRAELYQQLRARVTERVRNLRDAPDHPALRERLTTLARRLLGPEATVVDHPDGGVLGRSEGRRVDLSLGALAVRTLDRAGREVETLWAP
jgi:vacuolar-type H+-ATPase subunit E/Vma4